METGRRIKLVREKLSLTQQQLAEKLHVSRSYLAGIESGKKLPSRAFLSSLIETTGTSANWVLTGKGDGDVAIATPSHTPHEFTGHTDVQTVQYVVQYVETWLLTVDRAWTPEQKAETIAIACRLVAGWRERGLDQGQIDRQLKELLRLI